MEAWRSAVAARSRGPGPLELADGGHPADNELSVPEVAASAQQRLTSLDAYESVWRTANAGWSPEGPGPAGLRNGIFQSHDVERRDRLRQAL